MSSDDYVLSSLDFRSDVLIEIRDDTLVVNVSVNTVVNENYGVNKKTRIDFR